MVCELDNPIWHSLTSRHSSIALGGELARRYPLEVAPFAGLLDSSRESTDALLELVKVGETVGILNVHPVTWDGWEIQKHFDIAQYRFDQAIGSIESDAEIQRLDETHLPLMLELTALVYPAYFRKGTAELGDYVGVLENGQLCGMAGIRMSFDGHQELSAICTHPDHRGKGLARRLTNHLVAQIQGQGDVAFLHTEHDNQAARKLYESLGFTLRAMLPFVIARRTD